MVKYEIPYNTDTNIGVYYNESVSRLPSDDDYVCFVDGDTIFTTNKWGHQIEDIIRIHGENFGLFTCVTNRLGRIEQTIANTWESDDMKFHRNVGEILYKKNYSNVVDITKGKPMGGVMIMIRKGVWKKVGGFPEKGLLGVDNEIFFRVKNKGLRIGMLSGVYLYHWYRGGNSANKLI